MVESNIVKEHLETFFSQFRDSILKSGREPSEISLLAVSKRQSLEKMAYYEEFCEEQRIPCLFGENYAQELVTKAAKVQSPIHYIGAIQSNKIPLLVKHATVIETLATEKHARLIHQEAEQNGVIQDCYVQVNVSSDNAKHGLAPESVPDFLELLHSSYPSIRLCGLMTITRLYEQVEDVRSDYRRMRELYDSCRPSKTSFALSMGMSADYQIALQEGATEVRVGSALFGTRLSH